MTCDPDGGLVSGWGRTSRRGICRDNLLERLEAELNLGCSFQPRGSGPVMADVGTACSEGEEEEEHEEDKEDNEEEDEEDMEEWEEYK